LCWRGHGLSDARDLGSLQGWPEARNFQDSHNRSSWFDGGCSQLRAQLVPPQALVKRPRVCRVTRSPRPSLGS